MMMQQREIGESIKKKKNKNKTNKTEAKKIQIHNFSTYDSSDTTVIWTKADWNTCISPGRGLHGKHLNSFNHTCVSNSIQIWLQWLVLIKTVTVSVLCLKVNNHLLLMRKKRIDTLKIVLLFLEAMCLYSTIVHFLLLKYRHCQKAADQEHKGRFSNWIICIFLTLMCNRISLILLPGRRAKSGEKYYLAVKKRQMPELWLFKAQIMFTAGFVVLHCFHYSSPAWGSGLT